MALLNRENIVITEVYKDRVTDIECIDLYLQEANN